MRFFFSLILSSILILTFVSTGLATKPMDEPGGPKISLTEKSFNFNDVFEGTTVAHSFQVLHKGDKPLEIKNVLPG